jgi:phosphate/sulfate permease
MYQRYPSGRNQLAPLRPAPPASVVNAVRLMYAGAAVIIVDAIVSFASVSTFETDVHKIDSKLTPQQVNQGADALVIYSVIFAVVVAGLWLWMAWANKGPRSWARIVSSVLFGLGTLYMLLTVAESGSIGSIFPVVEWLIGAAALYLLWRPDSTAFFKPPQV